MQLTELQDIIRNAGGECWALNYAPSLLKKINSLEKTDEYIEMLAQLRTAKEPGDFRGRVLEINFAALFAEKGINLQYGAKQGMSGDIDFFWDLNKYHIFIEMKLLGQDQKTKDSVNQQLENGGIFKIINLDDTKDIARIQLDIFQKSSIKKFNPEPKKNWINLVAVDISELQLGCIDVGDCVLSVGGNDLVSAYFDHSFQRANVIGCFEANDNITPAQAIWIDRVHKFSGIKHPREYIHGVLFIFRTPKERAALSYQLIFSLVWNSALVNDEAKNRVMERLREITSVSSYVKDHRQG